MTPSNVTGKQMGEWRRRCGMSQAACAKRLGLTIAAISMYESGARKIPKLVAWAMSAVEGGLKPYGDI